jgi:hypothetical protein
MVTDGQIPGTAQLAATTSTRPTPEPGQRCGVPRVGIHRYQAERTVGPGMHGQPRLDNGQPGGFGHGVGG